MKTHLTQKGKDEQMRDFEKAIFSKSTVIFGKYGEHFWRNCTSKDPFDRFHLLRKVSEINQDEYDR